VNALVFRLNNEFWLDSNPHPTYADILLKYKNDLPDGVMRLLEEDVPPTPEASAMSALQHKEDDSKAAQPPEFSFVICFLHAQRAGSHIHDRPFFSYPIEPILSIAPDINSRGGLDRDQRMAVRHWHFPEDRRGEETYFRVFCKVQRGKSKQLMMS